MKKLSDFLLSLRKQERGKKKLFVDEKTIFFLTEKIITSEYGIRGRENVSPRLWKNKKLFLACRNSLWSGEIWMNRERIREKLNRELGGEEVSEIKTAES